MFKKALSYTEYIFGVLSTTLLLIVLVIVFNVFMSSCSSEIFYEMNEVQISNLQKDSLYLFLISPMENPYKSNFFYETSNFYENDNLIRYNSIPLDLDAQGENFQIKIDDLSKIQNINLDIYSGDYSNIALIHGSLDNVLSILEEELIFPDIILWNELSEDHDYVIAGCSSPRDYVRDELIHWINEGGTLITTDHSIKIIEDLFGKEFVYSGENMIKRDFIDISFKSNSNNLIGSSGRSIIQDSFSSAIKNQSTVLAEYRNIDDEFCKNTIEGCGYPIHYFNYGNGKVIHFAFHLDSNEEIAKNLFNNINSNFQKPTELSIHNSTDELIKIDNFENFETVNLIDYISDCENECYETFTIRGDGNIILRQPKMEISSHLYSHEEMSLIEYLIYALSKNDEDKIEEIKEIMDNYLNLISSKSLAHKMIISNSANQDDELFNVVSSRYREHYLARVTSRIVHEAEYKLYNNESFYLSLETSLTNRELLRIGAITYLRIALFTIGGGGIAYWIL